LQDIRSAVANISLSCYELALKWILAKALGWLAPTLRGAQSFRCCRPHYVHFNELPWVRTV